MVLSTLILVVALLGTFLVPKMPRRLVSVNQREETCTRLTSSQVGSNPNSMALIKYWIVRIKIIIANEKAVHDLVSDMYMMRA